MLWQKRAQDALTQVERTAEDVGKVSLKRTFELSVEGLGGDIQVGMGCICVWSEAVCFRLKERWAKARRCEPLWPVWGTRNNSIWWVCRTGCRGSESEAGGTPVPQEGV